MEQDVDFARLGKMALMGAVLAIVVDFGITNYGEEMKTFITELVGLLTKGDISDFPGSDTGASA